MNKKGFSLIEIIVVIALLGAIMILVVPNLTKNYKDSKKRLFYDNVVSLYTSAGRSFLLLDNPSSKTFSNDGNVLLDAEVSDDITYKIIVNSYGEVISIYVTDGIYTYFKSKKDEIKKGDIKLDDIVEGTDKLDIPNEDDTSSDGETLLSRILNDNPTISERSNFSTPFTTTNTGTLYKATESIAGSTAKDVYYFAGDAKNNWVKFGKHQTSLIKYRGYYTSDPSNYREYSTMEECTSATAYNTNCTEFKFYSASDDIYWRIIRTNSDGSIRLLYSGTSPDTTKGYLGISLFNTLCTNPKYVGYMYGDNDITLGEARTNTNDSTIKTYIDNWYEKNFTAYTNYLSNDAVYCNDRVLASGSTYTTTSSSIFYFKPYERLYTNKTPTYDCTNNKDAFSVNNTEAKLKYPIALMTADEIAYAGGVAFTTLISPYVWYYLNSTGDSITGIDLWLLLSPGSWSDGCRNLWLVTGSVYPGRLYNNRIPSLGVRPAISLKSCVLYKSGNGSADNPYEIIENGGC